MIVQLANGAAFVLEAVRAWDRSLESPGTLRLHLSDGVRFNVNKGDWPTPGMVEEFLLSHFGPVVGPSPLTPGRPARRAPATASPQGTERP